MGLQRRALNIPYYERDWSRRTIRCVDGGDIVAQPYCFGCCGLSDCEQGQLHNEVDDLICIEACLAQNVERIVFDSVNGTKERKGVEAFRNILQPYLSDKPAP